MVRRRLTLKRIDPWSVLKFGFVANIALLAIQLLGGAVLWFFVRRLRLIEKVCEIATDVGFSNCAVDGGNLFRAFLLLGVLAVIIQTGVLVFLTFLANLIADLTGGISVTVMDDTPGAAGRGEVGAGNGAASVTAGGGAGSGPVGTGPAAAVPTTPTRSTVDDPTQAWSRLSGEQPRTPARGPAEQPAGGTGPSSGAGSSGAGSSGPGSSGAPSGPASGPPPAAPSAPSPAPSRDPWSQPPPARPEGPGSQPGGPSTGSGSGPGTGSSGGSGERIFGDRPGGGQGARPDETSRFGQSPPQDRPDDQR